MDAIRGKRIALVGAASCLGAPDYRCESAPLVVRSHGLLPRLERAGCATTWKHFVYPYLKNSNDPLPAIADYCRQLASYVHASVKQEQRVAVIGGDHSCAIGTWSGMSAALHGAPLGMIWVDAHMDSHTPETSYSGAVHGMPLAALLGVGPPLLTQIATATQKVAPENACLIGVRSYEPDEKALLESLGVRVFYMEEIHQKGLDVVMSEALDIAGRNTAGFGVSVDLDAIDPQDAPGVGSPEAGGIKGDELVDALIQLNAANGFMGVEVVELNPVRDRNNRTVELATSLLVAALTGQTGKEERHGSYH